MAEIAVLVAFVQAIVDSASRIRDLGESYYQATEAWNDFPTKVHRLRITYKVWVEALYRVGTSDKDVIDTLNEAVSSLNVEEGRRSDREEPEVHQTSTIPQLDTSNGETPTLRNELTRASSALNEEAKKLENMLVDRKIKPKGCKARVSRFFSKTHAVVFPGTLGRRLQRLVEVLDAIPNLLELKQKAKAAAERLSLSTPYRILFHDDKRYVHLDDTERKIQSKLGDSAGPAIVLLHGGTGTGKSTLARHLALYYDQQTLATPTFQQVIFLKCGPNVVTLDMQLEILQWLAFNRESSEEDQPRNSALKVAQQLKGALTSRRILIIFDDVWESGFLHDMIKLFGKNVKCLVTSQKDKLCSGLSSAHPVLIQTISIDAAKKIVAGHVGFQEQFIQIQEIENIVDQILLKTGLNPLAIASVVSAVDEERKLNPEEWNDVYQEFKHSLNTTPTPRIFDEEYSQSFWAAKKVSVRSLSADAKRVLLLMHLCTGPSVPVAVIRFLYETESREEIPFRYAADEVEGRELVQLDNSKTERSWSTHFVQNLLMNDDDEDLKRQKQEVFEILEGLFCTTETRLSRAETEIGRDLHCEDALVKTILCALYSEDQFATKAASELNVTDGMLTPSRRSAFEPITTLLGLSQSDKWTLDGRTTTKSALRNYFCIGKLDEENIASLLTMSIYPPAQLKTLAAVNNNLLMGEFPIITERSKLLTGIVKLLSEHDQPDTQKQAVRALANLASGTQPCKLEILQHEGALEGLVMLLTKDEQPDTQEHATRALANLAIGTEPCSPTILQQEGALEGLVTLLSKTEQPDTQKHATRALGNLANGTERCRHTILQQEGALKGLVTLLSQKEQPDTQGHATRALANLANGTERCRLTILQQEGALEGLVTLLSKEDQPDTQGHATRALANLAIGTEPCELNILRQEGALEGLVTLLSKEEQPDTQGHATRALANLANGTERCRLTILQQEGALEGLKKLLSKDNPPDIKQQAARALASIQGIRQMS